MTPSVIEQLDTTWPGVEWRVMFHGTCSPLEAFTEEGIGLGGDDNSALGVHLAEWPTASSGYAEAGAQRNEGQARVLVVAIPARSPKEEPDYYRFFGFDEDGQADPNMGKAGFAKLRQDLLSQGIDVIDFEDGEGPISVALNPNDVLVLGSMSLAEAELAQEAMDSLDDAYDARMRLEAIVGQGIRLEAPNAHPVVSTRRSPKR